jgi:hypothetical protein
MFSIAKTCEINIFTDNEILLPRFLSMTFLFSPSPANRYDFPEKPARIAPQVV